jgi:septal ring factor EnvC (AmiA/AmiB activator)
LAQLSLQFRQFFIFCSTVVLLLGPNVSHATTKTDLQHIRKRIDKLQKEIDTAEETKSDVLDNLKQSEKAISDINRKLYELSQQQNSVSTTLVNLQKQSNQLRQSIHEQQNLLSRMLYSQYVNENQDPIKLMLNAENPTAASSQIEYYGYIARERAHFIGDLRQNLATLQQTQEATKEKSAELAQIHKDQATQKQALEKQKAAHTSTLAKLSGKIAARRKEVATLKLDEKRLTNLLEKLARAKAEQKKRATASLGHNSRIPQAGQRDSIFEHLKGKLALPVVGELLNHFGSPRADTGVPWKGLFIKTPPGEAVKAIANGHVVFADWLRGFGNIIIIDHDGGYMSLYGNNESLYKHVGDMVKAGDTIAATGNSGGNPQSGLYFEIRYQSKPIDPLQWCRLK